MYEIPCWSFSTRSMFVSTATGRVYVAFDDSLFLLPLE